MKRVRLFSAGFILILASCSSRETFRQAHCDVFIKREVLNGAFEEKRIQNDTLSLLRGRSSRIPFGTWRVRLQTIVDSLFYEFTWIRAIADSLPQRNLHFERVDLVSLYIEDLHAVVRHPETSPDSLLKDVKNTDAVVNAFKVANSGTGRWIESSTPAGEREIYRYFAQLQEAMNRESELHLEMWPFYNMYEHLPQYGIPRHGSAWRSFHQFISKSGQTEVFSCAKYLEVAIKSLANLKKQRLLAIGDTLLVRCSASANYRKEILYDWSQLSE